MWHLGDLLFATLSVLGFLLVLVVGGSYVLSSLEAVLNVGSEEEQRFERATAREALADYAPLFDGELVSGTEARIEGSLRGEPIEIAYLEVSSLLVVKLWTQRQGGVLSFEVTRGWFGASWSGPGRARAQALAAGQVFADHLRRLWDRGWKSVSLEQGVLVLRGECSSDLPPPEVVREDLISLSRIGVICETGGLLLSGPQGSQICPYCRTDLATGPGATCTECGTEMHLDCREENLGCVVFGCAELGQGRRRA